MLKFTNIRKAFGSKTILDNASFNAFPGEKMGFVGPNGAGKSTIFKIITDEISPDKGEYTIRKNARVAHLRQQFRQEDKLMTILEYTKKAIARLDELEQEMHKIEDRMADGCTEKDLDKLGHLQTEFEQLGGYLIENRAETALIGLGFKVSDLDRPLIEFSGGWQMRAELARVLISDPDLMLLDEPTNYLDVPAIEWLLEFMRSFQGTLLVISHDRFLLNSLCDVTLEVFMGKATRYSGNYDYYRKERDERSRHLESAHKNQELKKEKLEQFITKFKAKASKAAQAKSKQKQLDKMDVLDVPQQQISGAKIRLKAPPRCGQNLVELTDIGKSYNGVDWLYKGVNLTVENGDKIGILGTNGMGKTTLMRIMAGQIPHEAGTLQVAHGVKMGYHSQEFTQTIDLSATVFQVAKAAGPGVPEKEVRSILGSFGFQGEDIDKQCEVLSGGEKVRLSLARHLLNPPNFLLLDEPTTHLDIQSLESLQEALTVYEGTFCIVSHDIEFLSAVSTSIIEISPNGFRKFHGDYKYYHEKIAEEQRAESNPQPHKKSKKAKAKQEVVIEKVITVEKTENKNNNETAAEKKERKRRETEARKEFNKKKKPLETRIKELEVLIADKEEEKSTILSTFETEQDGQKITELTLSLKDCDTILEDSEGEWEELSMKIEELQEEFEATI